MHIKSTTWKWWPLWIRDIKRSGFRYWFLSIQGLKQLRQYGEYDKREYYIFDNRQLVYLVTSKVACTSIKMAIAPAYGLEIDIGTTDIHSPHLWNCQVGHLATSKKAYYKFSFVRNPFDRLVSCYRDKVLWNEAYEAHQGSYFHDYIFSIPTTITFAEFVKLVVRIPDFLADRHFRSQYSTLYRKGELIVDYVGKFENLAQDWNRLASQYGFSKELPHLNRSHNNKGTRSDFRTYYTRELAQLVYERFKKDFELFGYTDAYHELLDFIDNHPTRTLVSF